MYKFTSAILALGFWTPKGNYKQFENGVFETKNAEVAKHLKNNVPEAKLDAESPDPDASDAKTVVEEEAPPADEKKVDDKPEETGDKKKKKAAEA